MERRDDETVKRGRVRHRANLNSCFETHGVGKSTGGEDGVHELPYRPAALAIATPIGIGVERFHSVKRAKVSLCLCLSVCHFSLSAWVEFTMAAYIMYIVQT